MKPINFSTDPVTKHSIISTSIRSQSLQIPKHPIPVPISLKWRRIHHHKLPHVTPTIRPGNRGLALRRHQGFAGGIFLAELGTFGLEGWVDEFGFGGGGA